MLYSICFKYRSNPGNLCYELVPGDPLKFAIRSINECAELLDSNHTHIDRISKGDTSVKLFCHSELYIASYFIFSIYFGWAGVSHAGGQASDTWQLFFKIF